MTSIIESLLAVFKDFHWLVSIDMLLVFFVNYLMFHAAGRVKISWWLLFIRWPFISCFDSPSSYGIQIFT